MKQKIPAQIAAFHALFDYCDKVHGLALNAIPLKTDEPVAYSIAQAREARDKALSAVEAALKNEFIDAPEL